MRIALTGTPGVGKTSAAETVCRLLGLHHIEVSEVACEMGAVVGEDKDSFLVDVDMLKEKIGDMDDIVIDSHFAEVFDTDFVFVLRCEPGVLCARLKERGYSEEKVKENVTAEILDYCLVSAAEHHDAENIFEVTDAAEIVSIVKNPEKERSLAFGCRTHFLTEENLGLVG